jgi:hypothetical protein
MGLNQGLGNRQAQARSPAISISGFFHPIKAVKDMRQILCWDASPVIGNAALDKSS